MLQHSLFAQIHKLVKAASFKEQALKLNFKSFTAASSTLGLQQSVRCFTLVLFDIQQCVTSETPSSIRFLQIQTSIEKSNKRSPHSVCPNPWGRIFTRRLMHFKCDILVKIIIMWWQGSCRYISLAHATMTIFFPNAFQIHGWIRHACISYTPSRPSKRQNHIDSSIQGWEIAKGWCHLQCLTVSVRACLNLSLVGFATLPIQH